jgi:hypothetical protein
MASENEDIEHTGRGATVSTFVPEGKSKKIK